MKRSTVTAEFSSKPELVWKVVTNLSDCSWRSDVTQIISAEGGRRFWECTAKGFQTEFTITCKQPFKRYEFDLKNQNMSGHWSGIFSETATGTKIEFTEEVNIKSPLMNLLAGMYLKKQQAAYVRDLRAALDKEEEKTAARY